MEIYLLLIEPLLALKFSRKWKFLSKADIFLMSNHFILEVVALKRTFSARFIGSAIRVTS